MRNRQKERFLILGSLFKKCIGSLGQAENTFGIIEWDEGFVCRFPPVPMSIAIGVFVNEISLVISMILEPTEWSTALAKKTADIPLFRFLEHFGQRKFLFKIHLPLVHHHIMYGNTTHPGSGHSKLDACPGRGANRRRTIGIGKTHTTLRQLFQVWSLMKGMPKFRSILHHGNTRLGIAQIIRIDQDEVGCFLSVQTETR